MEEEKASHGYPGEGEELSHLREGEDLGTRALPFSSLVFLKELILLLDIAFKKSVNGPTRDLSKIAGGNIPAYLDLLYRFIIKLRVVSWGSPKFLQNLLLLRTGLKLLLQTINLLLLTPHILSCQVIFSLELLEQVLIVGMLLLNSFLKSFVSSLKLPQLGLRSVSGVRLRTESTGDAKQPTDPSTVLK